RLRRTDPPLARKGISTGFDKSSMAAPAHYGNDRLFVYLRLDGEDNNELDTAMTAIESSGQPVVRLGLRDVFDIGAEFFRWEMATAVAGSILGINPFDQPNVQAAKGMTENVLEQYESAGELPAMEDPGSIKDLLNMVGPGDYLAIMAYVPQTPELDLALDRLRHKITERHGIATTMGYGPRFLHSTGQLHKGGPSSGLFLQFTADHPKDIDIPGTPFTFGVLADAQAVGDLRALKSSNRRAIRVNLGSDFEGAILRLLDEMS
ncbi:MAG: glucose-6-phosphate isomerase, partial [Chloroflexi bacterium]|nr:glucose-6-phosphate isomerase [Chloroflexota bacterium]